MNYTRLTRGMDPATRHAAIRGLWAVQGCRSFWPADRELGWRMMEAWAAEPDPFDHAQEWLYVLDRMITSEPGDPRVMPFVRRMLLHPLCPPIPPNVWAMWRRRGLGRTTRGVA
jgi:hypothetical protein